uniref:Cadherin domain-containing protein n=1 Tax=Panagrellus redivivus TaxID=6233 RepID=A0A7E4V3F2_PANRE
MFALSRINDTCGELRLTKELDADLLHSDGTRWQSFNLLFEYAKSRRKASLDIQVVDVNDITPKFVNWRSEVNVSEKLSVGSVVQRIQTFDPDTGVGGVVRFFIEGEKFSIENERCANAYCHADLVLKVPLDYESSPVEYVTVTARDGASLTKHTNEASENVTINVVDEQDTPPIFLTVLQEPVRILESVPIGSKVLQVNAIDGDRQARRRNDVFYDLSPPSDYFKIDSVTGAVTLIKELDREMNPKLTLTVVATEQDETKMTTEMTVEFIVEDSDDNLPQCSAQKYMAHLDRTKKTLEVDGTITVFDQDQGKNAQFNVHLNGEYVESFTISPKKIQGNAELTLAVNDYESLEYVTDAEIKLEITLEPRGSVINIAPSKCLVIVELDKATPKNKPKMFKLRKSVFNVEMEEGVKPPQVVANLTDGTEKNIHFAIEGDGAMLFNVNEKGQLITLETLNAEEKQEFKLKVVAVQNGSVASSQVTIEVIDVNDKTPVFELSNYKFNVTEETETAFYVKAVDHDATEENSKITYSIEAPLPVDIILNEKTGRLSVPKLDSEKLASRKIEFQVTATDSGVPPLSSKTNVTLNVVDVNDNAPFFSKRVYSVLMSCPVKLNSTVTKVKAIDMDVTGNTITYELPGEMQKYFQIDTMTGMIKLVQELPTIKKEFHFNVIARDAGVPPKQSVARVNVQLVDCELTTMIPLPTAVDVTQFMEVLTDEPTTKVATTTTPVTSTSWKLNSTVGRTSNSTTKTSVLTTMATLSPIKPVMFNKTFNKLDSTTRVFVPQHIATEMFENSPVDTLIIDLGTQNSSLSNYDFHFSAKNPDHNKLVKLTDFGELRIASLIDYEKTRVINGSIFARSDRRQLLFATVTIEIRDQNDNVPTFRLPDGFIVRISPNVEQGYVLPLPYPLADDKDASPEFSNISYELFVNSSNERCFQIDKASSLIQVVNAPATCAPSASKLLLTVQAGDNPKAPRANRNFVNSTLLVEIIRETTTEKTIAINQTTANLTLEVFDQVPNAIDVFEDEPLGSVLLVLPKTTLKVANEAKTGGESNMDIEYSIRNSDLVEIASGSELRLRKSLKGYNNQKLCAQIEAKLDSDSLVPQITSKSVCLVTKQRPKAPVVYFPTQNSIHKFKENTPYETLLVFNASSTILDPKLNSLKYGLLESPGNDWQHFSIDSRGVLKTLEPFDFEKQEKYNLQVQVCDFNDSCTTITFRIQVEDLNDHCPVFVMKQETFNVPENQRVSSEGALVGTFAPAEDADGTAEKRSVCYRLDNNDESIFFLPDNRKPALYVRKSLDREEQENHNVTVVTMDCHHKERDLNCTEVTAGEKTRKLLIIKVTDVNDNFPKFTQKEYYGKVIERKTKFGAKILQVHADDPDSELKGLHYSISSAVRTETDVIPCEDAPFHIDSGTGIIVSHVVYSTRMPHSYNFRVVVRDSADHEDEASVTISVINYNEQVELEFEQPEDVTRKNQQEISKLMMDVTSLYFVIDDISGHGNATNLLAHFLEKDKLLASAAKALTLFEETKSEQAQRARNELRRTHSLKKIFSDSARPDLMNSMLNNFADVYSLTIGSVFFVLFILFIMLASYLCCRRQSKNSAKLNVVPVNQDLIFGNTAIAAKLPVTQTVLTKTPSAVNYTGVRRQRTSTLRHAAPRPTQHGPQHLHQQHSLTTQDKTSQPPDSHLFDALQSTEL